LGTFVAFVDATNVPKSTCRRESSGNYLSPLTAAREHELACLHVDFDPAHEAFYRAAGFAPTAAGLIGLDARAARIALLWLLLAPIAAAAETSFRVESPAGPIALEVQHDGATLRLRLQRPVDLETSTRALDDLLAKAFAGHAPPDGRVSIDVGRIIEHPWLSQRLAEAALRSSRWDAGHGKPRIGSDNLAVAQLIDEQRLVDAWASVFARHGIRVRNASVEKVLIGSVGTTAELAPLTSFPDAAGKRLPFDAILWLQLERTNP
jgi:hypothetical protein